MADGLLGSFDNVMAGLTADEIDALAEPLAADDPPATEAAVVASSADHVVDLPSDLPAVAPHRVVDPRAQAVADRLLRRTRPVAHHSVIVPERSNLVARLVVVADHSDELDGSRRDAIEASIRDGDTIVIGRGETARQADSPEVHTRASDARASDDRVRELLVPYGVVSRQHCRVSRSGDVVSLVDSGSANGTVIMRDAQVVTVGCEPVPLVTSDVVATAGGLRPFLRFEIDLTSGRIEGPVS